jgi:plasmid stabilization system protein ParE
VWSPLAQRRAVEAVDYISQDRPLAAANWLDGLLERVAKLGQFERRGRVVREIGNPLYREIFFEPYRIIYRIDPSRVVILTLRHVRRAWDDAEIGEGV